MKYLVLLLIFLANQLQAQYDDPLFDAFAPNTSTKNDLKSVVDSNASRSIYSYYYIQSGKRINWLVHHYYDKTGNEIRLAYTDTLGNYKKAIVCGAPITKMKYNAANQMIERAYFDAEQKPMMHDCSFIHRETIGYDSLGFANLFTIYNTKNEFSSKVAYSNNEKGLAMVVRYLNEQGELIKGKFSIVEYEYDKKGRETKVTFKDNKNKILEGEKTVSYKTYEYKKDFEIVPYYNSKDQLLKKEKRSGSGMVEIIQDMQ